MNLYERNNIDDSMNTIYTLKSFSALYDFLYDPQLLENMYKIIIQFVCNTTVVSFLIHHACSYYCKLVLVLACLKPLYLLYVNNALFNQKWE